MEVFKEHYTSVGDLGAMTLGGVTGISAAAAISATAASAIIANANTLKRLVSCLRNRQGPLTLTPMMAQGCAKNSN